MIRAPHIAATALLLALIALCLAGGAAAARPGPADDQSALADPRLLLAVQQRGQQRRSLLQADERGRVKWSLDECTITKANTLTCDSAQANACCDGKGCTSWANNDVVGCEAQRFIGCCGTAGTRSTVSWKFSSCAITSKKEGTCKTTSAQACCDSEDCTSWANADAVSCSGSNKFACCGKK